MRHKNPFRKKLLTETLPEKLQNSNLKLIYTLIEILYQIFIRVKLYEGYP